MTKRSKLVWISCIALGWLFDFLFWKQAFGLNFALFTVLCLLGGIFILGMNRQFPARTTVWLIPLIVLFAAVSILRAEPLTLFLAFLFTLFLMLVLADTFLGGGWLTYNLADYFAAFFRVAGSALSRPLSFMAEVRKERAADQVVKQNSQFWPVVRGVVLAFPIVAIFAVLLASADAVFSSQLDVLLHFFDIENLPQYVFRLAYILVAAYLLAGVFLHASTRTGTVKQPASENSLVARVLGFTEATIVLGSVAALFAFFGVIQFKYFFGGQANITLAGYTYSEYARRGFGELVAVAFFSLLLILGLGAITRRELPAQRRTFSTLSCAIVALVMVMLVSAYERLALYETAYGFSRLRTYTHVALVWIALLLMTVVVLEIFHAEHRFALAALIAATGFAASLAVLNVDALIVNQNVARAARGADLDVAYLASLSSDSVVALVAAFETPSLPDAARDAVGAALFCRNRNASATRNRDWRSFNLAHWQADSALKAVGRQLSGYSADRQPSQSWTGQVTSPQGTTYDCFGSVMD